MTKGRGVSSAEGNEGIYEKCLILGLELRGLIAARQRDMAIKYKDLVFTEQPTMGCLGRAQHSAEEAGQ